MHARTFMLCHAVVKLPQKPNGATLWHHGHISKITQRRTALNQTFITIDIPCPRWIYHVRLRPCRIAGSRGSTKVSQHTWTLERGFGSRRVRQELLRKGGGPRSWRIPQRPPPQSDIAVRAAKPGLIWPNLDRRQQIHTSALDR